MTQNRNRAYKLVAVVLGLALLAAACGDSGSGSNNDNAGSGSGGESGPQYSPEQITKFQEALASTGCYTGDIDGLYGPETDAGIRAFQEAKGLAVDGIPGEQTLTALVDSVANGETDVCVFATVELTTSDGVESTLDVVYCVFIGEHGIDLESASDTSNLTVKAEDNEGRVLFVSPDGNREGVVESVEVGDHGTFMATGKLTLADDSAEPATFELTGICR